MPSGTAAFTPDRARALLRPAPAFVVQLVGQPGDLVRHRGSGPVRPHHRTSERRELRIVEDRLPGRLRACARAPVGQRQRRAPSAAGPGSASHARRSASAMSQPDSSAVASRCTRPGSSRAAASRRAARGRGLGAADPHPGRGAGHQLRPGHPTARRRTSRPRRPPAMPTASANGAASPGRPAAAARRHRGSAGHLTCAAGTAITTATADSPAANNPRARHSCVDLAGDQLDPPEARETRSPAPAARQAEPQGVPNRNAHGSAPAPLPISSATTGSPATRRAVARAEASSPGHDPTRGLLAAYGVGDPAGRRRRARHRCAATPPRRRPAVVVRRLPACTDASRNAAGTSPPRRQVSATGRITDQAAAASSNAASVGRPAESSAASRSQTSTIRPEFVSASRAAVRRRQSRAAHRRPPRRRPGSARPAPEAAPAPRREAPQPALGSVHVSDRGHGGPGTGSPARATRGRHRPSRQPRLRRSRRQPGGERGLTGAGHGPTAAGEGHRGQHVGQPVGTPARDRHLTQDPVAVDVDGRGGARHRRRPGTGCAPPRGRARPQARAPRPGPGRRARSWRGWCRSRPRARC